jgi:urea carboxylase
MFTKILIANRGAIACRILRTLRRRGIASVAVYSDADANAPHVRLADEAHCIGAAPASDSYLRGDRILEVARACGAQAIHPGYGFLSENADFAMACEVAGIAFIGPTPAQMRAFGLKHTARALAEANGLPLLPGSGLLQDLDTALAEALRIGYPVMLKSTAGGGGIGMQQCAGPADLVRAFDTVRRLAANNFKDAGVFLEKFVARARHIEVQLFGDGAGAVIALGERDCSVQRRNQKVVEETPAPGLTDPVRAQLADAAVRLGKAVGYRSAGTVEFVYDADTAQFYFLEVNTRLQVEHGVTEEVGGVDLVDWMIRVAAGEPPDLAAHRHVPVGHAVQARIYAEDPSRGFRPSSGLLTRVQLPHSLRVDGWIETGTEVSAFYDPMLAKVIAHGATREEAIGRLREALGGAQIHGIETNLAYLCSVLDHPEFRAGRPTTRLLNTHGFEQPAIEVLQPGTMTTVQDWPGRQGLWDVGVPPSGPMDPVALRLANRLVGNTEGTAALEMTATGATLRFATAAVIALTGATMRATLDDAPLPFWEPVAVKAGAVLKLGRIEGAGQRSYLAVQGGLDVPEYLGSRSTFTLGQFGGHGGRALRVGDVLRLPHRVANPQDCRALPVALRPALHTLWEIGVIDGPHGAPDFFTAEDIATFYATDWEVHYNSSRTGVRLIGPKPRWARTDGGEAGLHPSNIHDNAYAIGSIDFTGDMPVILGPDGPSLGGFVCPATIALAELWKIGQLRPGDRLRFRAIQPADAAALLAEQDRAIATLAAPATTAVVANPPTRHRPAVVDELPAVATRAAICIRQAGEDNLLVEFGPPVLDLELRFQVQALLETLQHDRHPALIDLTPGIRSLQIHFDARRLAQADVVALLRRALDALPDIEDMALPSRIVHLPLSWDDPAVQLATQRYMQSVRADAPWCPSNIEFIRRINGLDSIEQVREIVYGASYLVMGLGDVYLGAPVATPLDPRHRLVTTKYNPARTWTPENAVGIGGAYLCVYGMEGPGGYQFVGRTIQMWNRFRQTADFRDGKPWLLRFFDQIRFHPVSAEELTQLRAGFPHGAHPLRIEPATLRLRDYRAFLRDNAASIDGFKAGQVAAFEAERERWRVAGLSEAPVADTPVAAAQVALPDGSDAVSAPVSGNVWQLRVQPGQSVAAGDELLVLEAMKMEISVTADEAGLVEAVYCTAGKPVRAGDTLVAIRAAGRPS